MALNFVKKLVCSTIPFLLFSPLLFSQPLNDNHHLTRQDTLRGSINPERDWWDVLHYDIEVTPNYSNKTIKGSIAIQFRITKAGKNMQIDLQEPMELTDASIDGQPVVLYREQNVYHLVVSGQNAVNTTQMLKLKFEGKPREAIRPPWDGGWIWSKDKNGNPWMSVACQGLGASVWYPCKDHQSDEPDNGARLTINAPKGLIGVGNGRLTRTDKSNPQYDRFTWEVKNPINSYNIIPYIGKYATWHEVYKGEKGDLDCDYWVLEEDLDAAKKQFRQVTPMLQCFEHWFGPYPFYEDGYKLVQSPHLGMEHQSAVAYGNKFLNGYLGNDLSGTGWGNKWDFIIIHESGHEWFANNITTKDIADMWVHEGFTSYSETIYTQCQSGIHAGNEYLQGVRRGIQNDIPIIGPYGVNKEGSSDMYPKAANMIHMIRQIIGDDEKFRNMLREMNKDYYHQTVTSADIEAYMSKTAGRDLSKVYQQYLRTTQVPQFQYSVSGGKLSYRWRNCVNGFDMPLKVNFNGKDQWLYPTTEWQAINSNGTSLSVDKNFYVTVRSLD
ncbi:M1 family metallopeptidase [Flavihumibacter rivuli]|uniref:M1 family metallopeptidase n=1 Tax=Flavihumibacter rivuli TaxID=2838156 RepID=UPI001BDF5ECF|nr:M1 family metallopeptidase [Flavihumibacter rivuli]ULQ57923.1 M1 family metallopeptidase [Flavihumibacter rivuli]